MEEVTNYTEKALDLNKQNRIKTRDTKLVMEDVLETVNKLATN